MIMMMVMMMMVMMVMMMNIKAFFISISNIAQHLKDVDLYTVTKTIFHAFAALTCSIVISTRT